MEAEDRVEAIKAAWGPPPLDPMRRSLWEHGMELLAELPDVIARLVDEEGTDHPTLSETFNHFLPSLEGEVVWRFVQTRRLEDVRDAVKDVLRGELWQAMLYGHGPVRQSRIAARLAEDVTNNLARVIFTNPIYRRWFIDP